MKALGVQKPSKGEGSGGLEARRELGRKKIASYMLLRETEKFTRWENFLCGARNSTAR